MKKLLCIALSAILTTGAFASCSTPSPKFSPKISVTSSDAEEYATWLTDRLGTVPDNLVLGTGDSTGIDMTEFENDGYVIRSRGDETVISGKTGEGLDLAVRKYAKAAKDGAICEDTVYHEGYRIEKLTIADVDISNYTIYYSADANENMKFAVSELQRLVKKACGAELEAVQGEPTGKYIIEFKFDTDPALNYDGYRYSVNGTHLTFNGAVKRGCMYAVWRFLQNECGWDGLIYGDSILAEAEHINIPDGLTKSETPAFEYLKMYRHYWGSYKNDKATPSTVQNSYGVMENCCHGMQVNRFVSNIDYGFFQICYTDEEAYDECLANVTDYIQRKLDSGCVIGRDFFAVDIAQGDSSGYCTCANCMKVVKKDGGNSGPVVQFANRLSEELNEVYPGLMYQIFAYAGSNTPPKVTKPNEFVHITFCSDMNCSNHPFDASECGDGAVPINGKRNRDYAAWLEGWCALTKNVYVWYYDLDTVLQQYSVIHNIKKDFSYFHDLGLKGIFWQCQFDGLGIQRVEHQLVAELNWNMDMTDEEFEALLCNILEKEFGSEWESVREYINLWERTQRLVSCWQCWGWSYQSCWETRYSVRDYALNFDNMFGLFEDAILGADSKAQEERAENLSCHMIYEGCYSSYFTALEAGDTERVNVLSDRYDLMMSRLYKNGFDPCEVGIFTVDGFRTKFARTLKEAGETDWASVKDRILSGSGGLLGN